MAESDRNEKFAVERWRDAVEAKRTPIWKRSLYAGLRPVLSLRASRDLTPACLSRFKPDGLSPERGYPMETRRRHALPGRSLAGRTVLVQGTGSGADAVGWAALRPARIIATDLFEFPEWESVARHCRDAYGVAVEFHKAPLEDHAFLAGGSVDVCGSESVLEHCRNLDEVLRESWRLLKPGGSFFATYSPIWFTAGGDHFSGRGGLEHVFAHVEYEPEAYKAYFESQLGSVEDFQSGGRYVQLDLFSKLTTAEYLAAFERCGFRREWLVLETSHLAIEFRRRYPERMRALEAKWKGRCESDDFILKGNLTRLRKPGA